MMSYFHTMGPMCVLPRMCKKPIGSAEFGPVHQNLTPGAGVKFAVCDCFVKTCITHSCRWKNLCRSYEISV